MYKKMPILVHAITLVLTCFILILLFINLLIIVIFTIGVKVLFFFIIVLENNKILQTMMMDETKVAKYSPDETDDDSENHTLSIVQNQNFLFYIKKTFCYS